MISGKLVVALRVLPRRVGGFFSAKVIILMLLSRWDVIANR